MKEPTLPHQGLRMPPTLGLIGIILLFAAILTQVLPRGEFERVERTLWDRRSYTVQQGDTLESIHAALAAPDSSRGDILRADTMRAPEELEPGMRLLVPAVSRGTRTLVQPGTYASLPRPEDHTIADVTREVIGGFLQAPIRGFQDRSAIIAFILIIGGAFGIILSTGAIDALIKTVVARLSRGDKDWVVIPVTMVLFSLGGAIFGMSEEVIPFVMITIPLALRLGYDAITGICISWLAAGLGFAAAFQNPFTIGIAQGIAELPVFSGYGFRVVAWFFATGIGIAFVLRWAAKVKREPHLSPTCETDKELIHKFEAEAPQVEQRLGKGEIAVLLIVAGTVVGSAYGVIVHDWYMNELSGLFFAAGILSALVTKMNMHRMADRFVKGASDLVGAALIVAFSAGIVRLLQDGQVLDTILNAIAGTLEGTHQVVGAWLMFFFQTLLNFAIPSGSGQAAVTMPITAPLADLIGITRQTAVLAFQFGDGFGNMIIPTSAVTMSVLGIARIPWTKWVRWSWLMILVLHLYAMLVLAVAVLTGFS